MRQKEPNAIDVHVGSRVRLRRNLLSISQERLADALSLTFQQVQKYEKGTNRISASRLHQIADILGVPVAFFFEGAPASGFEAPGAVPRETAPDNVREFLADPQGFAIMRAFMRIERADLRAAIANLVEELAKKE